MMRLLSCAVHDSVLYLVWVGESVNCFCCDGEDDWPIGVACFMFVALPRLTELL